MPKQDPAAPSRVTWEPDFAVGHALIDAQHQRLLAQCNLLADLCPGDDGQDAGPRFDQAFDSLKTLALEHFETEASVLAASGHAGIEDHRADCEEFEYLADEIATTENFDRPELQRFLALWCLGHVTASARQLRAALGGGDTPA
jgi:hemerythrin